jgi:hypothetical protein
MIVRAKLNWGRWICDCPTDNCNNAEYAIWNEVKRKEMICAVCGQGPWSIVLPKNKDRIEEIVSSRSIENQNWNRGESVRYLLQENKKHEVS